MQSKFVVLKYHRFIIYILWLIHVLFLAYKFILTLSCTQVHCEAAFLMLKCYFKSTSKLSCRRKNGYICKDVLLKVKNEDIIEVLDDKS